MVLADSHKVSRVPWYSGYRSLASVFVYGAITRFGRLFQVIRLTVTMLNAVLQPRLYCYRRFGLFPFRSPLLRKSRLLSFPPGTEMVHFPGLPLARLWIQRGVPRFYRRGFPHSEICGSKFVCNSPQLIAACRVLHRHLSPRHPLFALSSLKNSSSTTHQYSIVKDHKPLAGLRSTLNRFTKNQSIGGADGDRTHDLMNANHALSQLSYSPTAHFSWSSNPKSQPFNPRRQFRMVGLGRVELPTSPLSGVRSSQLSYRPILISL